jgi:UDP-N-acetylmuramoyl-L-alanyl-D-glutamate--2,6-diaminopimelate ligase
MAPKAVLRKFIPEKIWDLGHFGFSLLGAVIYRFPSRKMMVIGVTGTNGKSTVVEILHQIFEDFGLRVASHSSIRSKIRDKIRENKLKMTMPGRLSLQKFLNSAQEQGCQIVILEVTSEGIKQYRDVGIGFDAAVLTNLRPEHIEAHGSFEAYREVKGKLFKKISRHKSGSQHMSIVNLDDPSAFYYTNFSAKEKFGFGLLKENSRLGITSVIPENIRFTDVGISFNYGGLEWQSPMVGDFNLYNILTALTTAAAFKIPLENIRDSLKKIGNIPGRLEVVQDKPFKIVVDYAHTPDALESVYRTVRSFWANPTDKDRRKKKPKLIVLLGSAGGGRDKWKRPELGKIADRFADKIILTNEDPYKEDPLSILYDIEKGISSGKHEIILDRREAIAKALKYAEKGDAIVITGKGSENMIITSGGPISWDDRKVVREELRKLSYEKE